MYREIRVEISNSVGKKLFGWANTISWFIRTKQIWCYEIIWSKINSFVELNQKFWSIIKIFRKVNKTEGIKALVQSSKWVWSIHPKISCSYQPENHLTVSMIYELSKNLGNIRFYRHFDVYQILCTVYANYFINFYIKFNTKISNSVSKLQKIYLIYTERKLHSNCN